MRCLLLLLGLLPALAQAEIYRWTDAQGRVHFGERPPAEAERIEVRPQVVERDAQTQAREARAQRFFQARREEREAERADAARVRAENQQNCAQWREQLSALSRGGTFFSRDAAGERQYFSDAQLDAARRELGRRIAQSCD